MEIYLILAIVAIVAMAALGYYIGNRGKNVYIENLNRLESNISELNQKIARQETQISEKTDAIITLTSERDVQRTNAEYAKQQIEELKETFARQFAELKAEDEEKQRQQAEVAAEFSRAEERRHADALDEVKKTHAQQVAELKSSFEQQLRQAKATHDNEIEALRAMNEEQVKSQLDLIREQMQTTSEKVLKQRQDELGENNKEQVSKIIDPLQKSLKDMQEALDKSKAQQAEALTRLDETIKINMQKSAAIGETADRLTRALTGEVKVQGNFGELKLKQLLEDLELKEGEQYDTQETTGGDVYLMLSLNANRDPESVGFYYGTADGGPFVNGAHKAYLALTEEQMGEAKHVWFDTTGINSVETTENHGADVYTITGVHVNRLSALPKGIYIVGGKKIVVR